MKVFGESRKKIDYRYVDIVQGINEDCNDIELQGLKSVGQERKIVIHSCGT